MKKLKSQSGRSMVEMLGVLAIIGVLSVGGIAGYSLSMRRHRANQVVDIVSKYYLVAYSQCQQKLMNREVDALSECNIYETIPPHGKIPNFTEAGVGTLPAGVTGVESVQISSNDTTGEDIIYAHITFNDQKLCQAVASVTGGSCWKTGGEGVSGPYAASFTVKQN